MKIIPGVSHLDHDINPAQQAHVLALFADRGAFFIETVKLPEELGVVPCGLRGPLMGDEPVTDVFWKNRGDRKYPSRMVALPSRQVREVSVIAGPYDQTCPKCGGSHFGPDASNEPTTWCDQCPGNGLIHHDCVLYTMFGGPVAPKEIGNAGPQEMEASVQFWSQHALSDPDVVRLKPGKPVEVELDPNNPDDATLIEMMLEQAGDAQVEIDPGKRQYVKTITEDVAGLRFDSGEI